MTNISQNKNTKLRGKMKKIFFSIFSIFLLLGGVAFTACKGEVKGEITLSSDYFVQPADDYQINISLNEGDERTATIIGKVKNVNDGRIKVSNDYKDIVMASVSYNASKDESVILVEGLSEGNAEIVFNSFTGSAEPVKVKVFVYSDILGLEQVAEKEGAKKTQFVEKNVGLELDSKRFLNITSRPGGESNRKDVEWEFYISDGEENFVQSKIDNKIILSKNVDGQLTEVASISNNNVLLVNDEYNLDNIELVAKSVYTELFANVELVVLEKISKEDILSQYGRTNDLFGELEGIASEDENGELSVSVVRNNDAIPQSEFYVKLSVNCDYAYEITPIVSFDKDGLNETSEYLTVTKENVAGLEENEYVFRVKGIKSAINPSTVYLSFRVDYVEYEKSVKTDGVKVAISDVVEKIVVNTEEGVSPSGSEFNIYTNYLDERGKWFNIQLKPETVLVGLDTYKIQLKLNQNVEADQLDDYILFSFENTAISFRKVGGSDLFEAYLDLNNNVGFTDNTDIFVKVTDRACEENVVFECSFVSTQAETVRADFVFNSKKAPGNDFGVEEGVNEFLATDSINTAEFALDIYGVDSADGLYLEYDKTLPISVSGITYQDGQIRFSVSNTENNFSKTILFTVKHKNGREAENKITLTTFVPLRDVDFLIDDTSSFGLAGYEYEEGSLKSLILSIASSVNLDFAVTGEYLSLSYEGEEGLFNRETNTINARRDIAKTDDTIKLIFKGYNDYHDETIIEKIIKLETYIPVSTVGSNTTKVDLIAKDSISSDDAGLSSYTISIPLRKDGLTPTYQSLDLFEIASSLNGGDYISLARAEGGAVEFSGSNYNYIVQNAKVVGNILSFEVVANSTNGYDRFVDTLSIKYQKFNAILRNEIRINVENAQRVEEVIWNNEREVVYLDFTSFDAQENSFIFVTEISPNDAYNKNLEFLFVADDGTDSNLVSISELGVVSIRQGQLKGGTGYIYILPEDAIKLVNGVRSIVYLNKNNDNALESVSLAEISSNYQNLLENGVFIAGIENGEPKYVGFENIIKKVRVVVADGQTEETALRIYDEEQLKASNPAKHYEIMTNLTLDKWNSLGEISGSIRGYIPESDKNLDTKGSRSNVVITIKGNSFVSSISESGKIRDLNFVGNVKDAFVAKTNNGSIHNITIDVDLSLAETSLEVTPSYVTGDGFVGAIVSTNNKTIDRVAVLGAFIEGDYAGGIAGQNSGNISNSYFEFYKFNSLESEEQIVNEIIANEYAGGLVGKMSGGSISGCYVYDYSLSNTSTESNIKAKDGVPSGAGAFVGLAEGESSIFNSFAVANQQQLAGTNSETISGSDYYLGYYAFEEGVVSYQNTLPADDSINPLYWVTGEDVLNYVNGGKKHLKFYQSPIENVSALEFKDKNGKVLNVNSTTENAKGILMLHELTVSELTLSQNEKNDLDQLNTVSFEELFGIGRNEVVVISENTNIISTTSNSVVIKGTGSGALAVYSKKDYSKFKIIEVEVIQTISNFANDTRNNSISVQEGFSKVVNYSITDTVFLGSREYDLEKDAYTIIESVEPEDEDKVDFQVSGFVGEINAFEGGEGSYILKTELVVDRFNEVEKADFGTAVINKFTDTINLNVFKGSTFIGVENESLTIYPSMVSNLSVDLTTGDDDDDIIVEIYNSNEEKLESSVDEDNDNEFTFNDARTDKIVIKKSTNEVDSFAGEKNYVLAISVADDYRQQIASEENYVLKIKSKRGTASNEGVSVSLKLQSQEIYHIDMANYLYSRSNGGVLFKKNEMTSTISPGNTSFMIVGVDPTFAYYDYFVVKASNDEGVRLNVTKMKTSTDASGNLGYVTDRESLVSYEPNGLKVVPYEREEQYIFKVYASTSIRQNTVVPFEISFFGNNGNDLPSQKYNIVISYQRPAEIIVNENKNSLIAKGGKADIVVNVEQNQVLDSLSLASISQGIYINNLSGPFEREDLSRYYTATLNAGVNAQTTTGLGKFQIIGQVSRVINGVTEVEKTYYTMTLAEFALKENTSTINARVGVQDDFDLGYVFDPETYAEHEDSEIVEGLNRKRDEFKSKGYYIKEREDFSINAYSENGVEKTFKITDRLYIENGYNSTKVVFNSDGIADCGSFELESTSDGLKIRGLSTTASPVRLRLENKIYLDKNKPSSYYQIDYYYDVNVELYTDEDQMSVIRSADDFLEISKNGTAENYILMNDIELVNYVPMDTSKIASLDGNGYSINITSFNLSGNGALERALFTNVSPITTLKNIRVNYYYGGNLDVDVSQRGFSSVKVAGLAINNSGIIYNCEVVSFPYTPSVALPTKGNGEKEGLIVNLKSFDQDYTLSGNYDCQIAGFVISNTGSITNSRVGGEEILELDGDVRETNTTVSATTRELDVFSVIGQGTIAGFVLQNSGDITASFAKQVEIQNNATNINLYTSGFVGSNSGRISTSFVQGKVNDSTNNNTSKTGCFDGTSISSAGYIAGFVSTNSGTISDAYSNILLQGKGNTGASYFSAGFVYSNAGVIKTCYSGCRIESSNISQSNFSGVDINGDSLNTGLIELSYYNGKTSGVISDGVEETLNTGVVMAQSLSSPTQFYGFTFASEVGANDGIWAFDEGVLTLTAPNQISFSHRACQGDGPLYVFPYAKINTDIQTDPKSHEYGGRNNPIIIRTAEEFKQAMGGADKSTNIGKFCQGGVITGSYRIVADINFAELNSLEGVAVVSSTKNSFAGILDGNGFEIKNISIGAGTEDHSLGLFSQIYEASVVNLKLNIVSITATTSGFVGGLAGLVYNGNLINIDITQTMPVENTDTTAFGVQGANVVGGVAGAVFGNSKLSHLAITDPIVQATFYDKNHYNNDFYVSNDKYADQKSIRGAVEANKNDNTKTFSQTALKNLTKHSQYYYLSNTSYAGGLVGYIDIYNTQQVNENVYTSSGLNDLDYKINNLRVFNTANIRGEVVGGLVGYSGTHSSIKDAGIILNRDKITSNILSYNSYVGGIVGYSAGTLRHLFAEHDKKIQDVIEDNYSKYYSGNEGVERGILDVFENTTSWDESVKYDYSPRYIGGLVGYARVGRLMSSYSKLNVISTVEGAISGGVIGKIGKPNPGDAFTVKANVDSTGISTTLYLEEVYASGDVAGKVTNDGITKLNAGGIIGELDPNARLTLTSVNAVNYFGALNYREADLKVSDGYHLSQIGIYAFVGKTNGATINYSKPTLMGATDVNLGYIPEIITPSTPTPIKVLPFEGYVESGDNKFKKLNALVNINSSETGYNEMSGAFLKSGNWSDLNWQHLKENPYPSLKFMNDSDVVYMDNYRASVENAFIQMKNGSKEIRVRGLSDDGTTLEDIDLREYPDLVSKYLSIAGFGGRFIGAWDKDGEKLENNEPQISLILPKTLFEDLYQGCVFEDLKIKFTKSAKFIEGDVNDASFKNIEFDYSEVSDKIILNTTAVNNNQVHAGLIADKAISTSFEDIDLIFGEKVIQVKINTGAGKNTDVFVGLLAGEIVQENKYQTLNVSNVNIFSNAGESDIFLSVSGSETGSTPIYNKIYAGLYAGKIWSNGTGNASINLALGNISSDHSLKMNVSSNAIEIYAGGYFGEAFATKATMNNDQAINLAITILGASESYVGGFIGNASINAGVTTGIDELESITTKIDYNNQKETYLGGLFGKFESALSTISVNGAFINTTISPVETSTISGKANLGGIFGYVDNTSSLELKLENSASENADLTSNITYNEAGIDEANIGGIAGYISIGGFSLNADKISSVINTTAVTSTTKTGNLNAGLMFGKKENGGDSFIVGNSGGALNVTGGIYGGTSKDANLGGIVGSNSGTIKTAQDEKKSSSISINLKIGNSSSGFNGKIKNSIIDNSYKFNSFNATGANVGGVIGYNTSEATIYEVDINSASRVELSTSNATSIGGAIGFTSGAVTLGQELFTNKGLFALKNTGSDTTYFGGVVGQVNSGSAVIETLTENTVSAYVTSNFFVDAKNVVAGGIVGSLGSGGIYNAVYGGAVKSYGTANKASHTFGGIVGIASSGTNIGNNASFGDDIVTYKEDNEEGKNFSLITTYIFGGIVGQNDEATVSGNYSLTTPNNDKIATSDSRGAINGSSVTTTSSRASEKADPTNLYSHTVTLSTDENGVDVGYMTAYETSGTARGYSGRFNDSILVNLIKTKIENIKEEFPSGHKLNPINLSSKTTETTSTDEGGSDTTSGYGLNGVKYYYFGNDETNDISSKVESINRQGLKLAIIGNARVIKYVSSSKSLLSSLSQNEIISGMNVNVDVNFDSTTDTGGLVATMTGGTIYAVALSGNVSIGGTGVLNVGAMVGNMSAGLIDESNSSVDVIYRAKNLGAVSGFATTSGGTNKYIRNSYSTGRVSSYIDANIYAFTNGSGLTLNNCYTISQVDWNDHTSTKIDSTTDTDTDKRSGKLGVFGGASKTNCWYDLQATEVKEDGSTSNTTKALSFNAVDKVDGSWIQSNYFNYGYPTRKFGYLKQSSYAQPNGTTTTGGSDSGKSTTTGGSESGKSTTKTTYTKLSWNNSSYGTANYIIIPNATKLSQVTTSTTTSTSNRYVLWYDIDLSKAESTSLSLGEIASGGIFDGQEHTISNGTKTLFDTIKSKATVKNLRLTDFNITFEESEYNTGILAGSSSGTIDNVIVKGALSGRGRFGGIVGLLSGGEISNCKNYAKIDTSATRVGGIVATITGGTISNCVNYGPINCTSTSTSYNAYAGGIAGYLTSSGKIQNCGNTNSVLAGYTTTKSVSYYAGGIVGIRNKGVIENCYNTAMVKAGNKSSTSPSYAGGIVGNYSGSLTGDFYNSGVIEALGKNGTWTATSSTDGNSVTISTTNGVNVYAGAIAGNDNNPSTHKYNHGTIIRNGVYIKDSRSVSVWWNNVKRSGTYNGATVETNNYKANITGYDDLGYPTSVCVIASRTIKVDDVAIVSGQTIISETIRIDTYYYQSKIEGSTENEIPEVIQTLMNNADASSDQPQDVTINGQNYQIVTDKNSFENAVKGNYREAKFTVDLNSVFTDVFSNYEALSEAGYKFSVDPATVSSNHDDVTVQSAYLSEPNTAGESTLTVGYICNSTTDVVGITFNYSVTATKAEETITVTVKANNWFDKSEETNCIYWLYVGDDTVTEGGYTSNYMNEGESYAVKIGENTYTGTYDSAGKFLVINSESQITVSEGTSITYTYLKTDVVVSSSSYYVEEVSEESNSNFTNIIEERENYYTSGSKLLYLFENGQEIYGDTFIINADCEYGRYINKLSDAKYNGKFVSKALTKLIVTHKIQGTTTELIENKIELNETEWKKIGSDYMYIVSGIYLYDQNYEKIDFNLFIYCRPNSQRYELVFGGYLDNKHYIYPFDILDNIQIEYTFDPYAYTKTFVGDNQTHSLTNNPVYGSDGTGNSYGVYQKDGITYLGTEYFYEDSFSVTYSKWYRMDKINTTHTFTKEKDSFAVYEISDNYGNYVVQTDNSTNKSCAVNYNFNYSKLVLENDSETIIGEKNKIIINGTTYEYAVDEEGILTLKSGDSSISGEVGEETDNYGNPLATITIGGIKYQYIYNENIITNDNPLVITFKKTEYKLKHDAQNMQTTPSIIYETGKGLIDSQKTITYTTTIPKSEYVDGQTEFNVTLIEDYVELNEFYSGQNGTITIGTKTYSYSYDEATGITLTFEGSPITESDGKLNIDGNEYDYSYNTESATKDLMMFRIVATGSKGKISIEKSTYNYQTLNEKAVFEKEGVLTESFTDETTGMTTVTLGGKEYLVSTAQNRTTIETSVDTTNGYYAVDTKGEYIKIIVDTPTCSYLPYSIEAEITGLKGKQKEVEAVVISNTTEEIPNSGFVNSIKIGETDINTSTSIALGSDTTITPTVKKDGNNLVFTAGERDVSYDVVFGYKEYNGENEAMVFVGTKATVDDKEIVTGKATINENKYNWSYAEGKLTFNHEEQSTNLIVLGDKSYLWEFNSEENSLKMLLVDIKLTGETTFKPEASPAGVILAGDINLGNKGQSKIILQSMSIAGNGYFLNYFKQDDSFMSCSGDSFIKDVNFAGNLLVTKSGSHAFAIGSGGTPIIKNIAGFGSISVVASHSFVNKTEYLLTSVTSEDSDTSSYVNYSAFNDNYGPIYSGYYCAFTGISKNYGVIIGFDGHDGLGSKENDHLNSSSSNENGGDALMSGGSGESFILTNVTNYGIIKAGNGGNGGRGGDGYIGQDTITNTSPTKGTAGGAGKAGGFGGDVQFKGDEEPKKDGKDGEKGHDGNTGHGGIWIMEFELELGGYKVNKSATSNSMEVFDYNVYTKISKTGVFSTADSEEKPVTKNPTVWKGTTLHIGYKKTSTSAKVSSKKGILFTYAYSAGRYYAELLPFPKDRRAADGSYLNYYYQVTDVNYVNAVVGEQVSTAS